MSDKTVVHSHSFPIAGLLGVVFITLKLCGIISWPWIWVLFPFWGGIALLLAIIVGIPLVALVAAGVIWLFAWLIGLFVNKK